MRSPEESFLEYLEAFWTMLTHEERLDLVLGFKRDISEAVRKSKDQRVRSEDIGPQHD